MQLNPDVMPRLRAHDLCQRPARQARRRRAPGAAVPAAGGTLVHQNIQQRFDTILRVSRAIVERQKSFFVHGELAMRPLVLREIADELGLHSPPSAA